MKEMLDPVSQTINQLIQEKVCRLCQSNKHLKRYDESDSISHVYCERCTPDLPKDPYYWSKYVEDMYNAIIHTDYP